MPAFPEAWSRLNVILSHDWLTGMRGGERVLEILCRAFPRAPIYTLIHNPRAVSETINAHPIHTSWLQSVPGILDRYRYFLPFFPSAVRRFNLPPADLVISTSHCVAKGIRPAPGTPHLCYCFTPMRYAWTFFDEYFGGHPIKAALARPVLSRLRAWDRKASDDITRFVAISRHVRQRILDFYGKEADVVYPPVDTDRCTPGSGTAANFDLVVSALVPYKRIDLAVRAYDRLGFPLKIVGIGSDLQKLRALAGPNVEFLQWQPDAAVLELYRQCRLLVFPGEEDFGIVPLEAQACGKPVVAYARGGALESVADGVSGIFFREQTVESLIAGVKHGAAMKWDPAAIRARAETFGSAAFIRGLADSMARCRASR